MNATSFSTSSLFFRSYFSFRPKNVDGCSWFLRRSRVLKGSVDEVIKSGMSLQLVWRNVFNMMLLTNVSVPQFCDRFRFNEQLGLENGGGKSAAIICLGLKIIL